MGIIYLILFITVHLKMHSYPVGSHGPENVLEIFFFSSHVELLKEPPEKKILDLTSATDN